MPVLLAALSALTFGVGDFLGGLAARRMPVALGAVAAQSTGLALLVVLALAGGGDPAATDLGWGVAAGTCGALGLLLFYWALSAGTMSVVAPLSAVLSALVPLVAGLALGERPGPLALVGAVAALVAIVLISREPGDPVGPDERDVPVPGARPGAVIAAALLAGVGFGLFFVFLSRSGDDSGWWPLVAARGTAVVLVSSVAVARRSAPWTRDGVRLGLLAGCFDVAANALFLVAARSGLLTLVGVVGAMYPASTVVLARVVLRERLARHQLVGLGLAVVAVAAVTAA